MSSKPRSSANSSAKKSAKLHCEECKKVIPQRNQALFVEEEVGRYFCDEGCIVSHFTSEIEKLEREYGKHVTPQDLSSEERERFAHFRWMALENPDEVWMETLSKGDRRYTLVAEYMPENKKVWAVAVCLMLRGEPSFLYLAFVSSDRNLVDVFRRGDQMKVVKEGSRSEASEENPSEQARDEEQGSDRLAEPWTEADSVRAMIVRSRKPQDIPPEDFGFYQKCLEETLQNPNELWSYQPKSAKRIYHFIKHYDHDEPYWYVVIAKDTRDETQIEIIDVFPTRDAELVGMCRHGKKEVLGKSAAEERVDEGENLLPEKVRRNIH
jgi:hypothetical protein